jgi:hypothetical protein
MTVKSKSAIYSLALYLVFAALLVVSLPVLAKEKTDTSGQNSSGKSANSGKKSESVIIGSVDNVTGNTLVIEDEKSGKKTEVELDKTSKVVGKDKKDAKVGSIKLKDLIGLISTDSATATSGGKLRATKIFIKEASSSAQIRRKAVQGIITSISGNVLTLAHQIQRDRSYNIITTADTVIKIKAASASAGLNEASSSGSLANLAVGQRITAIGDVTPGGSIIAKQIHVIPGKATGIFKKQPLATPSARLATPSSVATASASPTPSGASPSASPL